MPRKSEIVEKDIELLACAYLAGEQKTQVEIATALGLSQATVSRLLREARKEFLRDEVRFLREKVNAETMEKVIYRVSRRELGKELHNLSLKHAGIRGPILRVFPGGAKQGTVGGAESHLQEFSRQAAPFIRDLLLRIDLCGVSWGRTLSGLVSALQRILISPPRVDAPIKVIPLAGEPLGKAPSSFSSSSLAADLGRLLNGDNNDPLSLSTVPAFIPGDFTKAEWVGIWKLIRLADAYEKIFGNTAMRSNSATVAPPRRNAPEPLVKKLDMILTSVGPGDDPFGYIGNELFRSVISKEELKELALGDICGVCIERPGLGRTGEETLAIVRERWTGIRIEHLKECVKRGAKSDHTTGPLGVVVIAVGKSKAPSVLNVVKRGLVNILIIDDDLEEELDKLIKEKTV
jgi:DNA-binding transcriptional regulator LsrR (DeoR family)